MSCVQCQAYNHSLLGQSTMNLHYCTHRKMLSARTCLPVECVQARPAVGRKALPDVLCTFGKFPHRKPATTTITDHTGFTGARRNLTGTYRKYSMIENSTTLVLFTSDKRHWYPSNNTERHEFYF